MKPALALILLLSTISFSSVNIPRDLYPNCVPVEDHIFLSMKDRTGVYAIYTLLESYEGYVKKGGTLIGDYFWLSHVFAAITEFVCDKEFMIKTSGDYWLICNHNWEQDED